MFSLQQNWRTRENRFCLEKGGEGEEDKKGGREVAQTRYTHMNKYKNNKKSFYQKKVV
jgi:hypothetical protein